MDTIKRLCENIEKLNAVKKPVQNFLTSLTDKKSFVEMGTFTSGLAFSDGVQAEGEGIITGYATISGIPVYLFMQNFSAMRGSFSSTQAKKIESAMKMAAKSGTPFVSIIDSAGARLDEGTAVLEGYSKIIKLAADLHGIVPHVAVVKGACVGLMSAYACLADVVLFDEEGYLSVVSPSVVAAKAELKENANKFFNADVALCDGIASLKFNGVSDLSAKITEVLKYLSGEIIDSDNPNRVLSIQSGYTADQLLSEIVDGGKYLKLCDGYARMDTAFARIDGKSVGIIATNGEMCRDDFKKLKKFVNLLDNYNIPLITLVNSTGVESEYNSEINGMAIDVSGAFLSMALSDNPKIAVITSNAIGLPYSLLASKSIGFDYSIAFADASIAALSAEQAVNFLDNTLITKNPIVEKEKLIAEYSDREGNPFITAKDGYVDNIINPNDVRAYLSSVLTMLM